MTGPSANNAVNTPIARTATGTMTNARTYGLVHGDEKLVVPRRCGKWLKAYSANTPRTSVEVRLLSRWPYPEWANPAVSHPSGYVYDHDWKGMTTGS